MQINPDAELVKIDKSIKKIQGCEEKDIFVPRSIYTFNKNDVEIIFDLLENYRLLLESLVAFTRSRRSE